jgi:hypothetical protein
MNIRNLAIATLFASASATSVFASQSLHWVGGEIGFIEHNIPSTVTRANVMQDYQLSLQSKVDGSGGIQLGGDAGYLEPRHFYTVADGKLRHTDSISHKTAKPEYQHSATEHVVFSETYVN